MKRGQLGKEIAMEDGMITTTTNNNKRRNSSSIKKTTKSNATSSSSASSAAISPDLAKWMASQQQKQQQQQMDSTVVNSGKDDNDDEDDSTVVSFQEFVESVVVDDSDMSTATRSIDDSTSKKGGRQKGKGGTMKSTTTTPSMRQQQLATANAQLDILIPKLEQVLEEQSGQLDDILNVVQELLLVPSTVSFKQLFGSSRSSNFRLAWVGSDDAICHVGTGLHKVPLARLQEVFFIAKGNNRIELLEVIRLLGPFPNVKNTLQGRISDDASKNDGLVQIVMDSMVDGTGKEIMAGTADNIRRIDLQIQLITEKVLILVVPDTTTTTTTGMEDSSVNNKFGQRQQRQSSKQPLSKERPRRRNDPLEESGKHVLVFVKEDDLDTKLDALRVS
ncbi:hypothetical protein IV203_033326 [Nitzschia inconspicua]|uniref:Uncharacterized protein n=1 Tax=Nitzschia inconspicua TaxID=303405 RepID=A0A9K3KMM0_9STRA|nr:hypothetical protein IV203_033326 [Nitzschia inconspicua]